MAAPKRRQDPEEPDLDSQSDFQLLSAFTTLVSKERSQLLKAIAWEILRRYTSFLDKPIPTKAKDYNSVLGDARWGDAKRVEAIFGIKRGVLIDLRDKGLIKSSPLDCDRNRNAAQPAVRTKRLYDLISITDYVDSCADKQNITIAP